MPERTGTKNDKCDACGRSVFGKRVHEHGGKIYGGRCIYKVRGKGKLAAAFLSSPELQKKVEGDKTEVAGAQ